MLKCTILLTLQNFIAATACMIDKFYCQIEYQKVYYLYNSWSILQDYSSIKIKPKAHHKIRNFKIIPSSLQNAIHRRWFCKWFCETLSKFTLTPKYLYIFYKFQLAHGPRLQFQHKLRVYWPSMFAFMETVFFAEGKALYELCDVKISDAR